MQRERDNGKTELDAIEAKMAEIKAKIRKSSQEALEKLEEAQRKHGQQEGSDEDG